MVGGVCSLDELKQLINQYMMKVQKGLHSLSTISKLLNKTIIQIYTKLTNVIL